VYQLEDMKIGFDYKPRNSGFTTILVKKIEKFVEGKGHAPKSQNSRGILFIHNFLSVQHFRIF
jgi:hypothetical protein